MDPTAPEYPVQQQLDAYNARDITAFMPWWAEDCAYYEVPDRLLAHGAADIRARHLARFTEPNLHGRLISRLTVANLVVDQEIVTRTFPEGPGEIDVLAIYEIANHKIAKAWFKQGTPRLHATTIALRQARPEDAGAITALTREAYAKWVPLIGREPLPMTIDYAAALAKHRFDLLFAGPDLAALIETVPRDDLLLIENVAVRSAFQGRGFGRRLMRLAEDLAATLGLAGTRLYTNQRFAANIRLYTALGYVVEREEHLNGGIAVHMTKRAPVV